MGTDLLIISNHNVDFTTFDFDRLGREVATRLNQTQLESPAFYWLSRLYWENTKWEADVFDTQRLLVPWTFCADEHRRDIFYDATDWQRGTLSFRGPFEWEITVESGKAELALLPFRYSGWMSMHEQPAGQLLLVAYRKALSRLVQSLGGSEVTYLADNSHPLASFLEISDYAALRRELQAQLGPPISSFAQMAAWQDARWDTATGHYREELAYLVDDFADLDWSQPITLTEELRQLSDRAKLTIPSDLSLPFGVHG